MKQLMLGNAAVARGLYEAGCSYISSYPGTPSTEITEYAAKYDEIYAEWAPNEKVAMESALGAGMAGARSACAMKHVGLNVAADPLFTSAYTGVNGGVVVIVADDPGLHSSQNEQDSRHYAIAAKLPMLEPADSAECLDMVKAAYEISEKYDTPVILRTCTRIAHSQSLVDISARELPPMKDYVKNAQKNVMAPANATGRHVEVEKRMLELMEYSEKSGINRLEKGEPTMGFIASGACYQYVRELFPNASVLKIGMCNPLPVKLIREFAASVERVCVVEELDPIIENHMRANGIRVDIGKSTFGMLGELSQQSIAQKLGIALPEMVQLDENIPGRPPVMCAGCPHRGLFYVLNKLKLTVTGDIGCYTLGATPPLAAIDSVVCMGASISMIHGFTKVRPEKRNSTVAVIGDSTFLHSGVTGLMNVAYNKGISTVIILDNSITGMTGHQQNPATGLTLKNEPTRAISLEKLCQGAGIDRVRVVDPQDLAAAEQVIKEELAVEEPSVIIARRPCAMLKCVKPKPALVIDGCKGCRACMKLGCPAIMFKDKRAVIDSTLCVGCGLCAQLCHFDAIKTKEAL